MTGQKEKLRKLFIRTIKIAIGSCLAILIAEQMNLEYAATAGIVALLSTVRTKWATVRLSLIRMLSFVMTILLLVPIMRFVNDDWIGYGIFMFFLFSASTLLNWSDTISVNAVIGTHLFMISDLTVHSISNELSLVAVGIVTALFFNLFSDYKNQKSILISDMKYTEKKLQILLIETADYLSCQKTEQNVWADILTLEKYLKEAVERAYEYQDNTFYSHPGYYINYLEMRTMQCTTLHNLHHELRKIRQMPEQAAIIANYIMYMKEFVTEHNVPEKQLSELHKIFDSMKKEPLPLTHNEFEARAILYHILMDLEDFLLYKKRFIESLDKKQKEIYWKESGS